MPKKFKDVRAKNPSQSACDQAFRRFAEAQGISLEHIRYWGPWYDCFAQGFNAAVAHATRVIKGALR